MNVDVSAFNAADKNIAAQYAGKAKDNNIVNFFLNIIPNTFVSAFTSGEILQVLLVAMPQMGLGIDVVDGRCDEKAVHSRLRKLNC